jgi:hypothetical protein
MLPALGESSPSSKFLQNTRLYNLVDEHMPMAWRDYHSAASYLNNARCLPSSASPIKFPPSNPQEKGPENNPKKSPREGSENHHQEQLETTHPHLEEPRRIIYTCNKGSYKD